MSKPTLRKCWHCDRPTTHPSGLCTDRKRWGRDTKPQERGGCVEKGKLGPSEATTTSLVCVDGRWMNRKNAKKALGRGGQ